MSVANCFTFDASTGILTPEIQLEKHVGVLQVGIEEHNREKKHLKACSANPPKNFDDKTLRLRSGSLMNDRLVATKDPREVLIHVTESHKIKARKDSGLGVVIRGCRRALVQIRQGAGVTIHNSTHKWILSVPQHENVPEVTPA